MENTIDLTGIKACIFDMDGTLIDSLGIWHEIDINFFRKRNMPVPPDYEKKIAHMNFMQMAEMTKRDYHIKESAEEIAQSWIDDSVYAYQKTIPAKPYAKECLAYLKSKGIHLSLATTNRKDLYEPCLERLDMFQYFDSCVNVNDIGSTKSEPKIYLLLAEKMGCRPEEVIVFEDILRALKTAHDAHFKTAWVYDPHSEADRKEILSFADFYISSYQNIKYIEK